MKQPDKKVASPNQTCLDVGMCNEGLNYFSYQNGPAFWKRHFCQSSQAQPVQRKCDLLVFT